MGKVVVDKDSYTGKCIIVMASLTEVRVKRRKDHTAAAVRTTLSDWCRAKSRLKLGAERGTGLWTYACVDTTKVGHV